MELDYDFLVNRKAGTPEIISSFILLDDNVPSYIRWREVPKIALNPLPQGARKLTKLESGCRFSSGWEMGCSAD
jgi:hypothetical protein